MSIEEIMYTYNDLNKQLRAALSTMEKKDTVYKIREQMRENQMRCPHMSNEYNLRVVDGKCPYCGFNLNQGRQ